MSEPLLHIEERFKFVVMCILHVVIRVGDYLTNFSRTKRKDLPPATRDRVQDGRNCAKTKISLKGHASPEREETWHLGKAMKFQNHGIDVVVQMASLLTALQSWRFNLKRPELYIHREEVQTTNLSYHLIAIFVMGTL